MTIKILITFVILGLLMSHNAFAEDGNQDIEQVRQISGAKISSGQAQAVLYSAFRNQFDAWSSEFYIDTVGNHLCSMSNFEEVMYLLCNYIGETETYISQDRRRKQKTIKKLKYYIELDIISMALRSHSAIRAKAFEARKIEEKKIEKITIKVDPSLWHAILSPKTGNLACDASVVIVEGKTSKSVKLNQEEQQLCQAISLLSNEETFYEALPNIAKIAKGNTSDLTTSINQEKEDIKQLYLSTGKAINESLLHYTALTSVLSNVKTQTDDLQSLVLYLQAKTMILDGRFSDAIELAFKNYTKEAFSDYDDDFRHFASSMDATSAESFEVALKPYLASSNSTQIKRDSALLQITGTVGVKVDASGDHRETNVLAKVSVEANVPFGNDYVPYLGFSVGYLDFSDGFLASDYNEAKTNDPDYEDQSVSKSVGLVVPLGSDGWVLGLDRMAQPDWEFIGHRIYFGRSFGLYEFPL